MQAVINIPTKILNIQKQPLILHVHNHSVYIHESRSGTVFLSHNSNCVAIADPDVSRVFTARLRTRISEPLKDGRHYIPTTQYHNYIIITMILKINHFYYIVLIEPFRPQRQLKAFANNAYSGETAHNELSLLKSALVAP